MTNILRLSLDYSEVWALFIPLVVLLIKPKQPAYMRPVVLYVWLALAIDVAIDVLMLLNIYYYESDNEYPNNFLYNLHSLVRFVLFGIFFKRLNQGLVTRVNKFLPFAFALFVCINFLFIEDFFNRNSFSSVLLATESGLLLFYCLQYYTAQLLGDKSKHHPHFWVVTGLSIYVVINFFIFLFYETLVKTHPDFAVDIWDVHNISFIILCIFLAKAFYVPDME